ncbi:hypothetical protein WJX72_005074 [[Myrmecia] bisecta]|uniref:Uncharacterized protein n=1 Tax=[Myrmecia] bisecta TaxID=41462 RepID=A0AAW1R7J6_9CHLO
MCCWCSGVQHSYISSPAGDADRAGNLAYEPSKLMDVEVRLYGKHLSSSREHEGLECTEQLKESLRRELQGSSAGQFVALLYDFVLARADWHDLHQARPETSSIGNAQVLQALADMLPASAGLQAWILLSGDASSQPELQVSEDDDTSERTLRWQAVVACLARPDAVVLYHMPGHYSLVFAARAWQSSSDYAATGQNQHRQLLIACPGQQPNSWVDFKDVCSDLVDYPNTAIMVAARRSTD